MLLTKTVKVKITNRNKKFYLEKSYPNSIAGNLIDIRVDDLPDSSGQKLEVKCDYCDREPYTIRYCDYVRTKYEFIDKDACKKCWHKKRMDITSYKIENKLIKDPNERGYWSIENNVKYELNEFIKCNNYIGKDADNEEENKLWNMITWALKQNNLNLEEVIDELGYSIEELQRRKPNGYVIPFNELKEKIDSFVKDHGFFPDQIHLSNDFKIHSSSYLKHGTLAEIRNKLGYNDKKHLVDNRGFINKSSFELITANYLIAQNIPYRREQYPFKKFDKDLNYRSDFTFFLSEKEIHVEVWGGMKTFKNQKELYDYEDKMKDKLRLYKKYNIELISVTPDTFFNSMGVIKKKMYDIFSNYIELSFIEVKDRLVSTFRLHEMSDQSLFEEIMKFSKHEKVLPSHGVLRENKHEFLYVEVLKRYDSLKDFAYEFNMVTAYEARSKKVMKSLLTPTQQ